MTEPAFDADGLDSSWDGDLGDLPDLTGLGVEHFEAADEDAPPSGSAERAMPKLGTGARFAKLKKSLAAKGAKDPGALAAYIGRRKYGKGKFTKLAAKARGGSARGGSPGLFYRTFSLEDARVGSGRIVEAYAAVFNSQTEVRDQDGHYMEELDPAVFNRAISDAAPQGSRKNWRIGVFYNHGRTLMGTPSERHSMPIGKILDIKADNRGLWTEIQYNRTPLADEVLENIREGSIPGYSFSGNFRRSSPAVPSGGFRPAFRSGELPRVRRLESTLKELGPTPLPYYEKAEVVGMRAEHLLEALAADPELAMRMASLLRDGAPTDSPLLTGAPLHGDSPAEDSPVLRRSGRSVKEEINAARADFLLRYRR